LRRGWTRFWRGGSALLPSRALAQRMTFALSCASYVTLAPHLAVAQAVPSPPPLKTHIDNAHPMPGNSAPGSRTSKIVAHRNDELTLAGLRPGQDDFAKAQKLFRKPTLTKFDGTNPIWRDGCRNQSLSIITDADSGTIQEVRVSENESRFAAGTPSSTIAESGCASGAKGEGSTASSGPAAASRWGTGHGLLVGSACSRVFELYGQPGSRGPSTKDGQQLELLYYAFDWAGPDVPQVMAILCTPGSSAKPGRVVEITLMAPSL
jgi:hypothetical protein